MKKKVLKTKYMPSKSLLKKYHFFPLSRSTNIRLTDNYKNRNFTGMDDE